MVATIVLVFVRGARLTFQKIVRPTQTIDLDWCLIAQRDRIYSNFIRQSHIQTLTPLLSLLVPLNNFIYLLGNNGMLLVSRMGSVSCVGSGLTIIGLGSLRHTFGSVGVNACIHNILALALEFLGVTISLIVYMIQLLLGHLLLVILVLETHLITRMLLVGSLKLI